MVVGHISPVIRIARCSLRRGGSTFLLAHRDFTTWTAY